MSISCFELNIGMKRERWIIESEIDYVWDTFKADHIPPSFGEIIKIFAPPVIHSSISLGPILKNFKHFFQGAFKKQSRK